MKYRVYYYLPSKVASHIEKSKFDIGDWVIVTNSGKAYDTYHRAFSEFGIDEKTLFPYSWKDKYLEGVLRITPFIIKGFLIHKFGNLMAHLQSIDGRYHIVIDASNDADGCKIIKKSKNIEREKIFNIKRLLE